MSAPGTVPPLARSLDFGVNEWTEGMEVLEEAAKRGCWVKKGVAERKHPCLGPLVPSSGG